MLEARHRYIPVKHVTNLRAVNTILLAELVRVLILRRFNSRDFDSLSTEAPLSNGSIVHSKKKQNLRYQGFPHGHPLQY